MESIFLQRQGQKAKELVKEPKAFIHRPEEGVVNDPRFEEGSPSGIKKLQKYPKTIPKDLRRRDFSGTIKARAKAKPIGTEPTHKGTISPNWSLQLWKVYSIWPYPFWNSLPRSRNG
ncbi:hypothetical protein O181_024650 [Austropuccinia psidii MF-1]|uniref:Uncharacterized protein n=1 Tax=Austropuccinia psidii MF-1 TaxID=1389203 RepID=A0A9Q3CL97_9BASI|nr:hypothetical protein [Austropuccinia psidii MF-1]